MSYIFSKGPSSASGQTPEPLSDGWLWYRPRNPDGGAVDWVTWRDLYQCANCEIGFCPPPASRTQPRCWSCGRFAKPPVVDEWVNPFTLTGL